MQPAWQRSTQSQSQLVRRLLLLYQHNLPFNVTRLRAGIGTGDGGES